MRAVERGGFIRGVRIRASGVHLRLNYARVINLRVSSRVRSRARARARARVQSRAHSALVERSIYVRRPADGRAGGRVEFGSR